MPKFTRLFFLLGVVLVVPTATFAQASITGVVRDSSNAVLPGVTVEASSDALIEKVRSAVTDPTGRCRNHRPPTRHLRCHVCAYGIQCGQARGDRARGSADGQHQRRPAPRITRGDDHRDR